MKPRSGTIERSTKETRISATIGLDTNDPAQISTSLPFLDHMLEAFACHGRFALNIEASGDIAVDPHHLVEDCGIVLGTAIRKALGDFSGIVRGGFCIFPMDGSLAQVAIDLCGRPNLVWRAELGGFPLGGVDPRLFRDFFKGLVDSLGATLHISVPYQDGDHHAVEAICKAFGRALRQAVDILPDGALLSTKGVLGG